MYTHRSWLCKCTTGGVLSVATEFNTLMYKKPCVSSGHRRMSHGGAEGAAKFFGQKPADNKEKDIFEFITRKKQFIPSSKMKCPKSVMFVIIVWCESGKAILNETLLCTM